MRIFSQNLTNYDIPIPNNSILRINLAWVNSLDELNSILKKHEHSEIFMDLPIGRTKPPNNKYSFNDLISVLNSNKSVRYFAISNVDSEKNLTDFLQYLPNNIIVVPKIESPTGVKNIEEITNLLGSEKIVMLDHDERYSSMVKSNDEPNIFPIYVKSLIDFCNSNNVTLLRTVGVMFADTEKRVSDYVN